MTQTPARKSAGAVALARHPEADLARELKRSRSILYGWLSGQVTPSAIDREVIESRYAIPVDDWDREHVPPPAGEETGDTFARLDELLADIRKDASLETDARALSRLRADEAKVIALKHKLEREQSFTEDRIVRLHPHWLRVRAKIVDALQRYPDALAEVTRVLKEYG